MAGWWGRYQGIERRGGRGAVPVFERLKRVWFMAWGSPSGTGLEVLCVTAPRRESKKTFNLPITHKVPTVRKCVRMCLLEAKQPPVPPPPKKTQKKSTSTRTPYANWFLRQKQFIKSCLFCIEVSFKDTPAIFVEQNKYSRSSFGIQAVFLNNHVQIHFTENEQRILNLR